MTTNSTRDFRWHLVETIDVDTAQTNIIQIHAGLGGMLLGLGDCIPNIGSVCYVERELVSIESLKRKVEAGVLPSGPIWAGPDTFPAEGFRGRIHLISGTLSGDWAEDSKWGRRTTSARTRKQRCLNEALHIITVVSPAWVFLEIPYQYGFMPAVAQGLESLGYEIAGRLVVSEEVGATNSDIDRYVLAGLAASEVIRCKDTAYCQYPDVKGAYKHSPSRQITDLSRMARTIPYPPLVAPVYTPDWPAYAGQEPHSWERPRLLESRVGRATVRTAGGMVGRYSLGVADRIRLLVKESSPPKVSLAFRLLMDDFALKRKLESLLYERSSI